MCGRYVQARDGGELAHDLSATIPEGVRVRRSWNVAPTAQVPILVERLDQDVLLREVHTASWGLLPGWAKESKMAFKTFNARSETVTEKPMFRSAVRSRRCGIPATAYYEWLTEGKVKTPHAVRPLADSGILFAGLYEWRRDPAAEDTWLLSTTILTGTAPTLEQHQDLAGLHDRLPLALSADSAREWLSPVTLEKPEALKLVDYVRSEAYEVARSWEVYEVDRAVGNVRNDSPALLERSSGCISPGPETLPWAEGPS